MAYDSTYATKTMMKEVCESNPAFANSAIARCCKAWKKVYRAAIRKRDFEADAAKKAGEAYRAAMPPLTSRQNCRDFLTCVAHGILLGAIAERNGGKLLYAAQIALAMANSQQNAQNSSPSCPNLTDSEAKRSRKFEETRSK